MRSQVARAGRRGPHLDAPCSDRTDGAGRERLGYAVDWHAIRQGVHSLAQDSVVGAAFQDGSSLR